MFHLRHSSGRRRGLRREHIAALVASLFTVLAITAPASATEPTYTTRSSSVTVDGTTARASMTVSASVAKTAHTFYMCVNDLNGKDFSFPISTWVKISTSGTTYTGERTLAPGRYVYWACGIVDGDWKDFSAGKSLTVGGPSGATGSNWRLAFRDEFNGTSLDRSKWSTGWFGDDVTGPIGKDEPSCYDPARLTFPGNGKAALEIKRHEQFCSGKHRPYSSAIITSNQKYQFTYGAAEARIYLPARSDGHPANWPAFWATGQNWPTDGEIDIFESSGGSSGTYYHSSAGNFGAGVDGKWSGWHTVGAVWSPGKITYYWDGKQVNVVDRGVVSSPLYLILSFGPPSSGSVVESKMLVDYVRVWQR